MAHGFASHRVKKAQQNKPSLLHLAEQKCDGECDTLLWGEEASFEGLLHKSTGV